ncbi:MAG: MBOAT family O-acyltransferase, partial [Gammaproteobacteria bacterium]
AGPVLRYKDLADQFVSRTHSVDKFAEGAMRFMQGFVKKVFIADSIAPLADTLFALDAPSGADAWLGMLAYAAQLYFDFSGYSDMAIGLGLMMGFRFVENFNQPYISQSITEFWRRWHISLSGWLRDYLYIPLGGNRQGKVKTYRNVLLTMLLGGIWHGANWTFVFWGLWHGLWLALERACGWGNSVAFNPLRCLFTFLLVLVGWVLFRAESLGQAITVLNALLNAWFAPAQWSFSALYASAMDRLQVTTLIIAYALIVGLGVRAKWGDAFGAYFSKRFEYAQSVGAWLLLPLFAISILKLSAQSYSPFLYFQF